MANNRYTLLLLIEISIVLSALFTTCIIYENGKKESIEKFKMLDIGQEIKNHCIYRQQKISTECKVLFAKYNVSSIRYINASKHNMRTKFASVILIISQFIAYFLIRNILELR